MDIVNIENLYVSFDSIPILEDINLKIEDKGTLAIIGPNGGGKTTLLKVILGLIKPNRGKVEVFGKDPEYGRKFIGYLPQQPKFDIKFPISVFDVVLMGRWKGFKKFREEDKESALNALKTVGMEDFKDKKINELSGGQIQRVLLARALVRDPKLLLLDEPTASIDPEGQSEFYELLAKLEKEISIVIVTHDILAVSTYIEKIACLNKKLYYHGKTEEGIEKIEETYKCPIELIAHGKAHKIPHRILDKHNNKIK